MKKSIVIILSLSFFFSQCHPRLVTDEMLENDISQTQISYYVYDQVRFYKIKDDAGCERERNSIYFYGADIVLHIADSLLTEGKYILHNPYGNGQLTDSLHYIEFFTWHSSYHSVDSGGYIYIKNMFRAGNQWHIQGVFEAELVSDTGDGVMITDGHFNLFCP